ncbi:MAG: S8 family serine peptidase [Patescibacteria group bacterium]|nr:S8 family serine peptidase [Patescibacteria group bacterium]
MKNKLSKIKFIVFGLSIIAASFNFSNFNLKAQAPSLNYAPDELLIKLKKQDTIYKVHYSGAVDILAQQKSVAQMSDVEAVELNYYFISAYIPSDTYFSEEWYLNKIQAPQAWDIVRGGFEDVTIAVLDTGVDIDNPDLKDNIWVNKKEIPGNGIDDDKNGYVDDYYGWDFVKNTSDPRPKFEDIFTAGAINHGTIVAGTAAAMGDNGQGVAGITWKSKIMPLRVLNGQGVGSIDAVIAAVNYAKNSGAKIINLSFVGTSPSDFLAQALKQAWREGVFIVAAAGNEATGQTENLNNVPSYPVCLDANDTDNYIIGVGATYQFDRKASFSNYGSNCVDIMAPGSRIFSTLAYNPNLPDYKDRFGGYWSGTSVATPLVSGAAALIKSLNPLLTNQQVRDIILTQADDISYINPDYGNGLGRGRLNLYRAVDYEYSQLAEAPQTRYIVTAAGPGGGPHVRVMKSNGLPVSGFMAYDSKFRGGVKIATGDVDGDNQEEIITVPATLGSAQVKIFDINGNIKGSFLAIKNYNKGLNLASCDLDGDQLFEIIASPNGRADPYIYIFNGQGRLQLKFLAYSPRIFRGEVRVGCGDVDGDGESEIVTALGSGGSPQIKIFSPTGQLKVQWYAFLQKFTGGVNVAVGDVNGDGRAEIVTSIASKASPYIRVFDYFGFLQTQFLAYDANNFYGVTLAVNDLNEDNVSEIITGVGKGSQPHVRLFDYLGVSQGGFFAYDKKFLGGIFLATIKGK